MKLAWADFCLDFDRKTSIMGILNVTPDSFSDEGTYFDRDAAIRHGLEMVEDGADILDIGGESTRPGSDPLDLGEELRRTIPVIEALARRVQVPISIDTYKAEVAKRALESGASMVNDISGLRFDREMVKVVAGYDVPVVIMHIKGTPRDMQKNPVYEALIPEIIDYLRAGIRIAMDAGVKEERIVLDPGIGFGKAFDQNLEIVKDLQEFTFLQKPILVGPSRKAFIGKILGNAPPSGRLEGTSAAVAISIMNGADMVRVHDVKEITKVVRVADALKRGCVRV